MKLHPDATKVRELLERLARAHDHLASLCAHEFGTAARVDPRIPHLRGGLLQQVAMVEKHRIEALDVSREFDQNPHQNGVDLVVPPGSSHPLAPTLARHLARDHPQFPWFCAMEIQGRFGY